MKKAVSHRKYEKGIERIFSGRPISLKNGVNASTAEKYQKAIETAGAF
jgi:hypothetical protein